MGLFSDKKKTYVSSVAYPLGEDGADRTDTLKYTVLNSILQGQDMGDTLNAAYQRGQGMSLRHAFSYARDHYTNGLPVGVGHFLDQPNLTTLRAILKKLWPGSDVNFLTTLVGTADFEWWAEQYLAEKYGYDRTSGTFEKPPKGVQANANVAYDLEPDGTIRILLMNSNGVTNTLTFRPTTYVRMADYVHVAYQTVQVFKNAVTTTTRPATAGEVDHTSYTSSTVVRAGETQDTNTRIDVTIVDGVATVTSTPTVTVTSRPKYFIYKIGTGTYPSLDAIATSTKFTSPYYPSIPLRVDNESWTEGAHEQSELYKTSKKLLKKIGVSMRDVSVQVATNPSISDIDYAFVVFGVSLNSQAPESKQYLYRFVSYLRDISTVHQAQYTAWEDDFKAKYPGGVVTGTSDSAISPPTNTISIYSEKDRSHNYDVRLQWQYIDTQLVSGQVSAGAKPGTVTITQGAVSQFHLFDDMVLDSSLVVLRKQIDANTYEQLTISGLTYENFIYNGKSVILTAHDSLSDPDEGGFIIPLNQEIVRATPIVELTNLAYQCQHMVFNCYQIVRVKWYATGAFKVIMVIIAIVLCIFFPPAGVSMLAGLLIGVGVAVLLATIIAAVVYVLAMMVLMSILSKLATKVFGPKWGPVIAAIVSIMIGNAGSSASNTATASQTLFTASNIIQATGAVAGYYLQSQMAGIQKDLAHLTEDYTKQMDHIQDLTDQFLGTNLDIIDVQGLTDASWFRYEAPQTFLDRTLITGSDVCEITQGMIENFTEVGLRLETIG